MDFDGDTDSIILNEAENIYAVQSSDGNVVLDARAVKLSTLEWQMGSQGGTLDPVGAPQFSLSLVLQRSAGSTVDNLVLFTGTDLTGDLFEDIVTLKYDLQGPSDPQVTLQDVEAGVVTSPLPKADVVFDEVVVFTEADVWMKLIEGEQETDTGVAFTVETEDSITYEVESTMDVPNGRYVLYLDARDALGNLMAEPKRTLFTLNAGQTAISMTLPSHGTTDRVPFPITIDTTRAAGCEWTEFDLGTSESAITWTPFDLTGQGAGIRSHTLASYGGIQESDVGLDMPFNVRCNDGAETVQEEFTLVYDATAPSITSAVADPDVVNQRTGTVYKTTLKVQTNENTVCKFSESATASYTDMVYFTGEDPDVTADFVQSHEQDISKTDGTERTITVYVQCEDKAGRTSSKETITYRITSQDLTVTIAEPGDFVHANPVPIHVETNKRATCSYELDGGSAVDLTTSQTQDHRGLMPIDDAVDDHEVRVVCRAPNPPRPLEREEATKEFSFDGDIPVMNSVDVATVACPDGSEHRIRANFSASDATSSVVKYKYRVLEQVGTAPVGVVHESTSNHVSFKEDLDVGEFYVLSVIAEDESGQESIPLLSSPFEARTASNAACRESDAPSSRLLKRNVEGGVQVTISCSDASGCDNDEDKYGTSLGAGCQRTTPYTQPFIVDSTKFVCWKVCDIHGNCLDDLQELVVVTGGECAGGGCITCGAGDGCVVGCPIPDPDCGGGTCAANDGCQPNGCTTPDPDCGTDTCLTGDACLLCTTTDPDCRCPDTDTDGVCNTNDDCPGSLPGAFVDASGCAEGQAGDDDDDDGVGNSNDDCPDTPFAEPVDMNGCGDSQKFGCNDTIDDKWRKEHFGSVLCNGDGAPGADPDKDGMTNLEEYEHDTRLDPYNGDTDGDGISDGKEVDDGSDPLNPNSPIRQDPGNNRPESPEESNFASLMLLLLGLLLVVAGSVYLVYKRTKIKKKPMELPSSVPQQRVQRSTISPLIQKQRLVALENRIQQKKKRRSSLFDAFSRKTPPQTSKVRKTNIGSQDLPVRGGVKVSPVKVKSDKSSLSDPFAGLRAIAQGKRDALEALQSIASGNSASPESVVKKIGDLSGGTRERGAKDMLQKLLDSEVFSRNDALVTLLHARDRNILTREEIVRLIRSMKLR